ncbi:MAG: isoleucyl-tRNA synthetase, partial [Lysobacterales bacterium]
EQAGVENFKVIKEVTGEELTALTYKHPFDMLKECKVVTADYVTKEDGSGLVHTAPGHGADDFCTGQKYSLPTLMPVNDRGVYNEGPFEGHHVSKVTDDILAALTDKGVLLHANKFNHSYPHCWRCKKPIIFRATDQWFMRIDHNNLRAKCAEAIKNDVKFVPESGQERILGMVAGRPEWCLSRQRYWGVPIPALKSKKDEQVRLYPEVIAKFADIVSEEGTDAWFTREAEDFIPEGFVCPESGSTEFEKTFDILDVWFDSGVSHQAVVKSKMGRPVPTELYLEGSDQHRGWFQSALITAMGVEGFAPFKEVLTHGFVVDSSGRKMSKSAGNVTSPHDIIKNSGADILRLWVASSSYNEDIRISKEVMDRSVDGYRKVRNTFRYLLGNLCGFDPNSEVVEYSEMLDIDKWALNKLAQLAQNVDDNFNRYEFAKVYKLIYTFCNEDLSNDYLDILKDRLYISGPDSLERKSAQTALFHILNFLVRLLAPILVFTTEEIFDMMPKTDEMAKTESVHLLSLLDVPKQWTNTAIEEKFAKLFEIRPYVLKALEDKRAEGMIGSPLEAQLIFKAGKKDAAYLEQFGAHLADYFIVSQATVQQDASVSKGLCDGLSEINVEVAKAAGQKCERSWKYTTDVGADPEFPTLSLRCAKIVKELLNASEEEIRSEEVR